MLPPRSPPTSVTPFPSKRKLPSAVPWIVSTIHGWYRILLGLVKVILNVLRCRMPVTLGEAVAIN